MYGCKVFRKNARVDWMVMWNANIEEEGKGTILSDNTNIANVDTLPSIC